MDEDNFNDVVLIDDEDSRPSSETRPLMSLFERLISNDTKSNTVLTNSQILLILEKEFNMDITSLHELEVDIYINIVKKFLKDWPKWDEFDRIMTRLKKKTAVKAIKNILEQKYNHLKEYLRKMIEMAMPIANETVKKFKENSPKTQMDSEVNETVLEIYCTRKMLNKFIFNQPNPTQSNSLFNLMDFEHYKLNPATPTYTFASMLHWYGVRLSIELPYFQYTRFTAHRLKHVLVNEGNGPRVLNKTLDPGLHMRTTKTLTNKINIDAINSLLDKIMLSFNDQSDIIRPILEIVKTDLLIDSKTIEIPGSYKKHLSKYPYVRRLFENVDTDKPPENNLYIEETITPIQDFHIGKFINVETASCSNVPHLTWLKLECGECKQKFNGDMFMKLLRDHFRVYHIDEPDWTCTNCQRSFNMAELSDARWRHDC